MVVVAVASNQHSGRSLRAAILTRRLLCRMTLLMLANAAAHKVVGRAARAVGGDRLERRTPRLLVGRRKHRTGTVAGAVAMRGVLRKTLLG